ncbi:MAG: hypothetical protein Q7U20_07960 [Caulobacter sp.]|nr:hypothetical protein [Caulobacter sp.]
MRRRHLLAALPIALIAGAATASEPAKKGGDGQYVDLSPLALPVVVNGRLINYVFVQLRLNLTGSADAAAIRGKEPWFRDALVRAAHRAPFTVPTDYTRLDEARLKAVLLREAGAIVGARNLVSVTITSQTPKQRSRLPRPPAAAR